MSEQDAPEEALLAGFACTEAGLLSEQRQQGVGSAMCGATAAVARIWPPGERSQNVDAPGSVRGAGGGAAAQAVGWPM